MAIAAESADLAYFENVEITRFASINIALHQALMAATFRRLIQSLEERVGASGVDLGRRRDLASG
jgi:hypothetical protein